jgi:hypothetical protein
MMYELTIIFFLAIEGHWFDSSFTVPEPFTTLDWCLDVAEAFVSMTESDPNYNSQGDERVAAACKKVSYD